VVTVYPKIMPVFINSRVADFDKRSVIAITLNLYAVNFSW
jgi:hypothetical protein